MEIGATVANCCPVRNLIGILCPKPLLFVQGRNPCAFYRYKRHGRAPPSRESKPSPQASALTLVQPAATLSVRSAALPGWAIPLGLTLATRALAGQAWV